MISRRAMLNGLGCGLALPAVSGCGARPGTYQRLAYAPPASSHPAARTGLDAVIDISHGVEVSDFALVRNSNILGVIHKSSEGGDWVDPAYGPRRAQAQAAGLLWGAYHFGTAQYAGADQAASFLAAAQPGPSTVMALDVEFNDANPGNSMALAQAEAFVLAIRQATGRLPLVYVHPNWANGISPPGRSERIEPIMPGSILTRCELWLADYREEPELPLGWADRGWRLWQYVGDQTVADVAYGSEPNTVQGVSHCDRNLFAGDAAALQRFWNNGGR